MPPNQPLQLPAWLVMMAHLSKFDSDERPKQIQTAFGAAIALNMPISTSYRALQTLERAGYVRSVNQSPEGKQKGVYSVSGNGYPPRPYVLTDAGRKKLQEHYDILAFKRPFYLPDSFIRD